MGKPKLTTFKFLNRDWDDERTVPRPRPLRLIWEGRRLPHPPPARRIREGVDPRPTIEPEYVNDAQNPFGGRSVWDKLKDLWYSNKHLRASVKFIGVILSSIFIPYIVGYFMVGFIDDISSNSDIGLTYLLGVLTTLGSVVTFMLLRVIYFSIYDES